MDRVPPTDSPEVQQWIQDVLNTGIVIPDLVPTNPGSCRVIFRLTTVLTTDPGGCANNTQVNANDPDVCWWYCGGCTKPIDITVCSATSGTQSDATAMGLHWGLSYDDGPANFTTELLQYLDQYGLKASFFVVGSRVIEYPKTLQVEYMSGHQIAVHTWSHPYLTGLSSEQIVAEFGWSKKVIKDVLGVTPNLWRPPYGDME